MMQFIAVRLGDERWSCSHDGHIALQHVEELWELIDAGPSDEVADSGLVGSVWQYHIADDPGIEVELEHLRITELVLLHKLRLPCFRIHIHAAELIHFEALSILSDALLGEEDRARGGDVDGWGDEDEKNRRGEAAEQAARDIHESLHHECPCRGVVDASCQHGVIADLFDELPLARYTLHLREVEVHRDAGLGELLDQLLRIRHEARGHDEYLIDPLPADILGGRFHIGDDRYIVHILSDPVLIDDRQAGDLIAGVVVFPHALDDGVGHVSAHDEKQGAFLILPLDHLPVEHIFPRFPYHIGEQDVDADVQNQRESRVEMPLLQQEEIQEDEGRQRHAMLYGDEEVFIEAALQYVFQGTHRKQYDQVKDLDEDRHVPVEKILIRIPSITAQCIAEYECDLQADQIEQDEICMFDPSRIIFPVHSVLPPFMHRVRCSPLTAGTHRHRTI